MYKLQLYAITCNLKVTTFAALSFQIRSSDQRFPELSLYQDRCWFCLGINTPPTLKFKIDVNSEVNQKTEKFKITSPSFLSFHLPRSAFFISHAKDPLSLAPTVD
jgi:hypothetical protein